MIKNEYEYIMFEYISREDKWKESEGRHETREDKNKNSKKIKRKERKRNRNKIGRR